MYLFRVSSSPVKSTAAIDYFMVTVLELLGQMLITCIEAVHDFVIYGIVV